MLIVGLIGVAAYIPYPNSQIVQDKGNAELYGTMADMTVSCRTTTEDELFLSSKTIWDVPCREKHFTWKTVQIGSKVDYLVPGEKLVCTALAIVSGEDGQQSLGKVTFKHGAVTPGTCETKEAYPSSFNQGGRRNAFALKFSVCGDLEDKVRRRQRRFLQQSRETPIASGASSDDAQLPESCARCSCSSDLDSLSPAPPPPQPAWETPLRDVVRGPAGAASASTVGVAGGAAMVGIAAQGVSSSSAAQVMAVMQAVGMLRHITVRNTPPTYQVVAPRLDSFFDSTTPSFRRHLLGDGGASDTKLGCIARWDECVPSLTRSL